MPEITIKTFLTPGVFLDGERISFPFKRVDALLFYIACNKTASRREIVSLLWENADDETGYKNLRHTLYTLKKTLGLEIILSPQKATLTLNPDIKVELDWDRFVQEEDFSAYTGPFLQGFTVKNSDAFDEWAAQKRDFLQSKYLRGLYEKACDCLEKGDVLKAEQYAISYINSDPLDEQITVFLMKLYYKEQAYHKATKVYQGFCKQIAEELGISPLNETTALYYEIMNKWNDTAAEAKDLPNDILPKVQAQVAGFLQERFRGFSLSTGGYSSVLLCGEKGIGKTYVLGSFFVGH